MSENAENLRDFIQSKSGQWLLEELQKLRESKYQKGEEKPEKASQYLSEASGVKECINWIKSTVVTPKGQ